LPAGRVTVVKVVVPPDGIPVTNVEKPDSKFVEYCTV
jgi:hypothetical protein